MAKDFWGTTAKTGHLPSCRKHLHPDRSGMDCFVQTLMVSLRVLTSRKQIAALDGINIKLFFIF
jgi:hypothetical protein